MPDLIHDKRSTERVVEQNRRYEQLLLNEQLSSELAAYSHASQLMESHVGYGDRVDRFEYLFDDPGTNRPSTPISLISDRKEGQYWPFFRTEHELAAIRGQARLLELSTPISFGALSTLTNYVIGQGWTYEIKARKGVEVPESIIETVDSVLQDLLEKNNWVGNREREAHRRTHRDGESLLWLEPQSDGLARFRFAEPENLTEPDLTRDLEEWLINQGELNGVSLPQTWKFGIHSLENDTETIFGYHFVWDDSGIDWDYKPERLVQHIKRNVDGSIKRGISDFYMIRGDLEREAKLRRNTAEGAALQAAIAWVFQPPQGSSESGIKSMLSGGATERFQLQHQNKNKTYDVKEYKPGTILHPPNGAQYLPGPMSNGREAGFELVSGLVMRAIGSLWDMPEFMISGDASNANYSSTLVSESPFVKAREHDQVFYKTHYRQYLWKALKLAYDRGLFGKVGMPFNKLRRALEIHIDAPVVDSRDKAEMAATNQILNVMGIKSRRTIAGENDLDYDEELSRMAEEPAIGVQEMPPTQTFNFATGEASGFSDEELQAAGEQSPKVAGEFADANRRTMMNKMRTTKDIVDDVESGKTKPMVGVEMLKTMGMNDDRAEALIKDAVGADVAESLFESELSTLIEEAEWITMNGVHVKIGDQGGIKSGPSSLKGRNIKSVDKNVEGKGASKPTAKKKKIETGSKNVKMSEGGTIKLTRPKNIKEANSMMSSMLKIQEDANDNFKKTRSLPENNEKRVKAELRLLHTTNQLSRAAKMARPFTGKPMNESLHESKLENMSAKSLVQLALDEEWKGYP